MSSSPTAARRLTSPSAATTTNSAAAGADLGVTVFIDDVPTIGVGDNDPDLFDLQSVEVLRGPQGTLFGRNVTGGALVVRTLQPTFTPHESVEATYGSYNLGEVRSYLTGPLIPDLLAGKIALQYRRQDGYLNNVDLGGHALSTSAGGGRAQLLYTPINNLRVLVGVDYNKDGSPYKSTQLIGNFQPASFPHLSYSPDDTNEGIRGSGDAEDGGAFARIDYTLPFGTLTSITGFRDIYDRNYHSTSGEPFNELLQVAVQQGRQYTEELRLASPSDRRVHLGGRPVLPERQPPVRHRLRRERRAGRAGPPTCRPIAHRLSPPPATSTSTPTATPRSGRPITPSPAP